MNAALQNTEKIKTVFLETQLFYAQDDCVPALITYLENIEPEFRSIAYEAVSMAIALKSFEKDKFPDEWLSFANGPALHHQPQVYIGLGWAIAKLNIPFLNAVKKLDPLFYFRIADGCGYYDGSFRKWQTIMNKQMPAYLPTAAMPMYDQGIGRSIWYTEKTDIHKICSKIETFETGRHADLWRGVGIAVAYVGGCNDADLKKILQHAATNSFQLACGAALAARSRNLADTMTADTNRCCRLWFVLTADDAAITNEDFYCNWIKQMEEQVAAGFK